jgi:steroid delta-isomerase-like uncharacterized protein
MATARELNEQGMKHYNNGDVDAMAALYRDDAVLVSPDGRAEGIDAIRASWADQKASFPDGQVESVRDIEDGDVGVSEFIFRGTNSGPLKLPDGTEIPATGKVMEIAGVTVTAVKDGKIATETMYYDNMAAFAALGLLPS